MSENFNSGKRCENTAALTYDPALGDPEHDVGRNTPFDALPDDWVCPVCGKGKWAFEADEESENSCI